MKWFRHNADSHDEVAAQVLIETHGMVGWGFYLFIKERITKRFGEGNLTLTTEESISRLAKHANISEETAFRVIETCLARPSEHIGPLLDREPGTGFLRCLSLLRELDNATLKNPQIKKDVESAKLFNGTEQVRNGYGGSTEKVFAETKITDIQTDIPGLRGPQTDNGRSTQYQLMAEHAIKAHDGKPVKDCPTCELEARGEAKAI